MYRNLELEVYNDLVWLNLSRAFRYLRNNGALKEVYLNQRLNLWPAYDHLMSRITVANLVRTMTGDNNINKCFYPRNLLQLSPCYRAGWGRKQEELLNNSNYL